MKKLKFKLIKKSKANKWIVKFADNGWMDWICPKCGWTENIDVHVNLGYHYCPNCGKKLN